MIDRTDPDVLTVDEVAAVMRCSRSSVYERIADGTLRAIKFGRLVRVPRSALDELLRGAA